MPKDQRTEDRGLGWKRRASRGSEEETGGRRGRLVVHSVGTGGQREGDLRVMLRMWRSLTKEFRLPNTLLVYLQT